MPHPDDKSNGNICLVWAAIFLIVGIVGTIISGVIWLLVILGLYAFLYTIAGIYLRS